MYEDEPNRTNKQAKQTDTNERLNGGFLLDALHVDQNKDKYRCGRFDFVPSEPNSERNGAAHPELAKWSPLSTQRCISRKRVYAKRQHRICLSSFSFP